MVIEKGAEWGEPAPGFEAKTWTSVDELAAAALDGLRRGRSIEALVAPEHTDLLAQLGLVGPRQPAERHRYPFDLGVVVGDDEVERPFLTHILAHRPLWAGEFAVVMNVGWRGNWYLGPRAHPNDGLADITVGRLSWRQRLAARRRVPTGSHLPHPDLQYLRRPQWGHEFPTPVRLEVDGRRCGSTRTLSVRIEPDCLAVVA